MGIIFVIKFAVVIGDVKLLIHAGGMLYAATTTEFIVGLCEKTRSISGFNFSGCIGASHRGWRTPIQ